MTQTLFKNQAMLQLWYLFVEFNCYSLCRCHNNSALALVSWFTRQLWILSVLSEVTSLQFLIACNISCYNIPEFCSSSWESFEPFFKQPLQCSWPYDILSVDKSNNNTFKPLCSRTFLKCLSEIFFFVFLSMQNLILKHILQIIGKVDY